MAEENEGELREKRIRKKYTLSEKISFCKQWRSSKKKDDWKEIGVAQSTFEKWLKKYGFKKGPKTGKFLRVVPELESKIEIKLSLPNQTQLLLKMNLSEAIVFVQGLGDGTAVIQ